MGVRGRACHSAEGSVRRGCGVRESVSYTDLRESKREFLAQTRSLEFRRMRWSEKDSSVCSAEDLRTAKASMTIHVYAAPEQPQQELL